MCLRTHSEPSADSFESADSGWETLLYTIHKQEPACDMRSAQESRVKVVALILLPMYEVITYHKDILLSTHAVC